MSPEAATGPKRGPAILAAVVCVLVMGGVIAMALGGRDEASTGGSHASGDGALPGTVPGTGGLDTDPALAGCNSVDPDNPPVLAFELPNNVADFGDVRQDEERTREVVFVNEGKGLLCVTRVATGCGCLKVRFKNPGKKMYNPGERGVIVMLLNTKGHEGKIDKKVQVYSNDLNSPVRSFTMRCDISRAVVASPTKIHFGQHPRMKAAETKLLLKSPKTDTAWEVTSLTGTRRTQDGKLVAYTYELKSVPDARFRVLELTIRHPGLAHPGPFRDGIVIRTTHPDRPEVLVTANFIVVQRILAVPPRMPLGFISPGTKRPPRRVILRPGGTSVKFEITKVTFEPLPGKPAFPGGHSGFLAEHGVEKGVAFVDVQYDGKSRSGGLLEAVLVVHTTDAEMPTVRIPVTARVRDS